MLTVMLQALEEGLGAFGLHFVVGQQLHYLAGVFQSGQNVGIQLALLFVKSLFQKG